ncbi:MAG: glycerol-3-phosphate acyltransferase [Promethearchaeota archaeon]
MDALDVIISITGILIGYVLGAVNPGYIFGRFKGIDIRKEGNCNAGTANVYRTLGLVYTIPTALYDSSKGLIAILIAYFLGVDFMFIQISGLVAIMGHVFPFYMQFRGGQGMATSTGIMIFYLINYINTGPQIFYMLIFIFILIALFIYISRRGTVLAIIVLPLLGYSVFVNYPESPFNIYFLVLILYMCVLSTYLIIRDKKIVIDDEEFKARWWRVAIRPVSLLFLLFYLVYSKQVCLFVIGIVNLCFISLDVFRFLHKQTNVLLTVKIKAIFRKGEEKKFSSMTIFLISTFLTILLFEIEIAMTALIFLVFGDMFGKIFGLAYGRHRIFEKSLEGTLAFYGCVLIFGYVLYTSIDIPLIILIVGGIAAPLIELFPLGLNDNFTVPVISGSVMFATQLFLF